MFPDTGRDGETAMTSPQVAAKLSLPVALAQFDNLPDSANVRLPVVAALNSISAPTVWRWVKAGRLPAPIKLGPNTTVWRVGDLRQNLLSQQ